MRWNRKVTVMSLFTNGSSDIPSWGARINTSRREPGRQEPRPEGCPTWAQPSDELNWQHYGVVVWDDAPKRIEVVSFIDVANLLDQLQSTDSWKSEGIAIIRRPFSLKQTGQA